ncbi:hypothetical protein DOY81_009831, partial [Sarcophaga bullata]
GPYTTSILKSVPCAVKITEAVQNPKKNYEKFTQFSNENNLIADIFMLLLSCHTIGISYNEIYNNNNNKTTNNTFTGTIIASKAYKSTQMYQRSSRHILSIRKNIEVIGNSSLNPHFNMIEVCCQGYKRYDFDWTKCVPDCGEKCQRNGFCLEGGICQCFDDFVLNHRNDCVPTCPLGCPDGQCYINGTCICNKGFELDATKKYCMPVCSLGCGRNEICDAPDTCVCDKGYAKFV